jgi:hypothetical protein
MGDTATVPVLVRPSPAAGLVAGRGPVDVAVRRATRVDDRSKPRQSPDSTSFKLPRRDGDLGVDPADRHHAGRSVHVANKSLPLPLCRPHRACVCVCMGGSEMSDRGPAVVLRGGDVGISRARWGGGLEWPSGLCDGASRWRTKCPTRLQHAVTSLVSSTAATSVLFSAASASTSDLI